MLLLLTIPMKEDASLYMVDAEQARPMCGKLLLLPSFERKNCSISCVVQNSIAIITIRENCSLNVKDPY